MSRLNYNNRRFRAVSNSATGEVGDDTVFHYHQTGDIVTADYRGREIRAGHLIAICDGEGRLDMRYHHVNKAGKIMTGVCRSTPEILGDGRIRLYEEWHWTSGDMSAGTSVLEEIVDS